MSIYYLRVCSLSLFLSLSLVRLSLSLVVRKACKVRRKKFRNSDAFFFASDIFRVSYTVRVERQKSHLTLTRCGNNSVRLQMTTSEKTTKKGENDEHTEDDDDDSKEESKEFMREKRR